MKKFLSFGLAVSAATGLFANTINWEIANLGNGDTSNPFPENYDIVFLSSDSALTPVDGKYDASAANNTGRNVAINTATNPENPLESIIYGTWTDDAPSPTTYYLAVKSGDDYYAVVSGDPASPVTIPYENMGSPSAGGATYSNIDNQGNTVSVRTEVAVPEPAAAVLALAGIAMLIRRRKA